MDTTDEVEKENDTFENRSNVPTGGDSTWFDVSITSYRFSDGTSRSAHSSAEAPRTLGDEADNDQGVTPPEHEIDQRENSFSHLVKHDIGVRIFWVKMPSSSMAKASARSAQSAMMSGTTLDTVYKEASAPPDLAKCFSMNCSRVYSRTFTLANLHSGSLTVRP